MMSTTLEAVLAVKTVATCLTRGLKELRSCLSARHARKVYLAVRGLDEDPVIHRGTKPKSISVEESVRCCRNMDEVSQLLLHLAFDLVRRLDEDRSQYGRRATHLTLRVRHRKASKSHVVSTSTRIPVEVLRSRKSPEERARYLRSTLVELFRKSTRAPFLVTLLGVSATRFSESTSTTQRSIRSMATKDAMQANTYRASESADRDREYLRTISKEVFDALPIDIQSEILNRRKTLLSRSKRPKKSKRRSIESYFVNK